MTTALPFKDLAQRWLRVAHISTRRSRRRVAFLAGGLAVGVVAVLFAKLADRAQVIFHTWIALRPLLPLALTPLTFVAIAYVTRRFVPHARGSGIPQTIAARRETPSPAGSTLVSMRVASGKIILTLIGLLGGASIGREGPTVQIGAAIMSSVGRVSHIQRAGLLLAGACAGIAAAFNTPLAGIVFGIEEMSQSFERRTSGLTLAAVIVAGLVSLALVGNYTYFGRLTAQFPLSWDWLAVVVCGAVCGWLGGVFGRIVIAFARAGTHNRLTRWAAARPLAFAGACGLGVALCGVLSGNSVFGTGYTEARGLLNPAAAEGVPYAFGALKFCATVLSTISGIPGGIFSPSLAIGAGLGIDFGVLFPHVDATALFMLGMVSYLTGVVQAPITSVVIVMEMTDSHAMLIPLMAAALIAQGASRMVCAKGVYHALAENLLPATPVPPVTPPQA